MRVELTIEIDEKAQPRFKPTYKIEAAVIRAIRHSATEVSRVHRRGGSNFRRWIVMHKAGTISLVGKAKEGADVIGSVEVRCLP
jgi:hypothetical protein